MSERRVSVVVPVYNVERYLNRCVESIVNQTYHDLEILLIDDGSPDNCPRMCDEWAQKDSRIKVIHKKNEGLGMARNTGIEYAMGEYICFFDSDDYVSTSTIEDAYNSAKLYSSDMVCFGMYRVDSSGQVTEKKLPNSNRELYINQEIQNEFLLRITDFSSKTGLKWNIPMSACCKLYSMNLIREKGWKFASERDIISEDFYSILKLCGYAKRISVLPKALYYYCENSSSLTQAYRPDRFEKVCRFYEETVRLCKDLGYRREVLENLADIYLSFVIAALKQENRTRHAWKERRKDIKAILDNNLLQSALEERYGKCVSIKKEILFWAMRKKMCLLCDLLLSAQNALGT